MNSLNYLSAAASVVLAFASAPTTAQGYPTKVIRIVVPYPAGGALDWFVRNMSGRLSQTLGHSILIDNRSGASGNIGTDLVAKAAPDGYTLLAAFSSLGSNAALYTKLPFDTLNDLAPITLLGVAPGVMVANISLPVRSVQEVIALAKKRPGEIVYASNPGPGSPGHLAMELFNMTAGIKMTHVPYKGSAPSIAALMNGEAQLAILTVDVVLPHVKLGKLRAIAVASPERFRLLPNIPTIAASGLREYEMSAWYALFVPAKTPRPIIDVLHRAVVKTLEEPGIRDSILQQGIEPTTNTPEQLHALLKADIGRWAKVAKAIDIKID